MQLRTAYLALLAVFGATCAVTGANSANSFQRDVVRRAEQHDRILRHKVNADETIEDALLSKAVPLEEFKAQLEASGASLGRTLEEGGNGDGDDGDDYYIDEDYLYSFSGWSLKYSKCQAIQRFSEDAVQSGEYSALVTDDVVILRLCPRRVCSSSSEYGCHYNYAEYAIGLGDYLKIMIKYTLDKRRNLCNFCAGCDEQRRLNEDEDEEEDRDEEDEDEEEDDHDDEDEEERS